MKTYCKRPADGLRIFGQIGRGETHLDAKRLADYVAMLNPAKLKTGLRRELFNNINTSKMTKAQKAGYTAKRIYLETNMLSTWLDNDIYDGFANALREADSAIRTAVEKFNKGDYDIVEVDGNYYEIEVAEKYMNEGSLDARNLEAIRAGQRDLALQVRMDKMIEFFGDNAKALSAYSSENPIEFNYLLDIVENMNRKPETGAGDIAEKVVYRLTRFARTNFLRNNIASTKLNATQIFQTVIPELDIATPKGMAVLGQTTAKTAGLFKNPEKFGKFIKTFNIGIRHADEVFDDNASYDTVVGILGEFARNKAIRKALNEGATMDEAIKLIDDKTLTKLTRGYENADIYALPEYLNQSFAVVAGITKRMQDKGVDFKHFDKILDNILENTKVGKQFYAAGTKAKHQMTFIPTHSAEMPMLYQRRGFTRTITAMTSFMVSQTTQRLNWIHRTLVKRDPAAARKLITAIVSDFLTHGPKYATLSSGGVGSALLWEAFAVLNPGDKNSVELYLDEMSKHTSLMPAIFGDSFANSARFQANLFLPSVYEQSREGLNNLKAELKKVSEVYGDDYSGAALDLITNPKVYKNWGKSASFLVPAITPFGNSVAGTMGEAIFREIDQNYEYRTYPENRKYEYTEPLKMLAGRPVDKQIAAEQANKEYYDKKEKVSEAVKSGVNIEEYSTEIKEELKKTIKMRNRQAFVKIDSAILDYDGSVESRRNMIETINAVVPTINYDFLPATSRVKAQGLIKRSIIEKMKRALGKK